LTEINEQILQGIVSEFAKIAGVPISTSWSPNVTHVIASTDMSGACKRTLKFLMAILNGKWVISIDCKSFYYLLE
jgi:BRCA1-associated RING domain protein 1